LKIAIFLSFFFHFVIIFLIFFIIFLSFFIIFYHFSSVPPLEAKMIKKMIKKKEKNEEIVIFHFLENFCTTGSKNAEK